MRQKELFYLSLTIFFTIIAWIIVEAFKIETAIESEKQQRVIIEKRISLDKNILEDLKLRIMP